MADANDLKPPKECPFSITKMNKYYLFPFLVPIVCWSTKFWSDPLKYSNDDAIKEKAKNGEMNPDVENTYVFLYLLINSTSHMAGGGLLYLISVCKTKSNKKKNDDEFNEISGNKRSSKNENNIFASIALNELEKEKYKKIKLFLYLIGMAFILTLYNAIKAYATGHPQLEKRLYFLFFFTLFNIFILKREIFIHQKLSLAIAALGMAILFITYFKFLDKKYNCLYDVILLFGSFFYSLYLFLVKYLTVNYGMSPFLVIFSIGLFSTLFIFAGFIPFSLITKQNLSYILNLFNCTDINYVCFGHLYLDIIIYFSINAVLQVLIVLVIYYFSPEVFAISDILSPMLSFIQKCVTGSISNPIQISLNVIGYLIISLGAFTYNEIIVCNFCGLDKYTWKSIGLRGIDELDESNFRDSNSIDSYMIDRESSDGDVSIEMKKKESDNNNNNNDSLIETNKNKNETDPK